MVFEVWFAAGRLTASAGKTLAVDLSAGSICTARARTSHGLCCAMTGPATAPMASNAIIENVLFTLIPLKVVGVLVKHAALQYQVDLHQFYENICLTAAPQPAFSENIYMHVYLK